MRKHHPFPTQVAKHLAKVDPSAGHDRPPSSLSLGEEEASPSLLLRERGARRRDASLERRETSARDPGPLARVVVPRGPTPQARQVDALDEMILSTVKRVRAKYPSLRRDAPADCEGRRLSAARLGGEGVPPLTSVGTRLGERSMATLLCTVIRDELDADCALLEGGSVRGAGTYESSISFAHLRGELPFENLTAVVAVDGASLSAFVKHSRSRPRPEGSAFFLHGDVGLRVDPRSHDVTAVAGAPLDVDRVYDVAVGFDLGFGSGENEPMTRYAAAHPERMPDKEQLVPAKVLVMRHFCRDLWKLLPSFDDIDSDGSGYLDHDEVRAAYVKVLGNPHDDDHPPHESERIAAENMVNNLILALDVNRNGQVDRAEYAAVTCGRH